jgi:chemotaxis protein methyltransferase CheR
VDGFLALGAAETVIGVTDRFVSSPDWRGLYRPAPSVGSPSIVPAAGVGRTVQVAR